MGLCTARGSCIGAAVCEAPMSTVSVMDLVRQRRPHAEERAQRASRSMRPLPSFETRRFGALLRACESLDIKAGFHCLAAGGLIPCVNDSLTEARMTSAGLFGDLPQSDAVEAQGAGAPRLRGPVRDQIELRPVDLDALIGPEHPARVIWDYLQRLDLRELEEAVKAREHTPGQAPASPRLLLALWLFATSQGIGSARALDRLYKSHDAYRWLCGGVSVNYHGLADFRIAHPDLLDRLLTENVATLSVAGVINLDEVVQDGVRVRALPER